MKKLVAWSASIIVMMMVLAGCNTSNEASNSNTQEQQVATQDEQIYPLKFKDASGEMIEIKEQPEKVVSLIPSNTEILFALGSGDEIVGVTDNDDYPKETNDKEKIGGMEFNLEKIISLQPDLVLSHETVSESAAAGLQQLRDVGITVVTVPEAKNFEETYDEILAIGVLMNKSSEAEEIVKTMKEKVKVVTEKVAKVADNRKVSIEISDEPEIFTAGKDTFIQEMFNMLKINNIAKESGWYQISSEVIINENPDVILVMYDFVPGIVEKVKKRTGFQTVSAVQNDRVVQISEDEISRTGPRLADGLEQVAKAVYPEAFE